MRVCATICAFYRIYLGTYPVPCEDEKVLRSKIDRIEVSPLLEDDDTRGGTLHIAVKPLLHNVGKHVEDL